MTKIQDLYFNAILADATYALDGNRGEVKGDELYDLLKGIKAGNQGVRGIKGSEYLKSHRSRALLS